MSSLEILLTFFVIHSIEHGISHSGAATGRQHVTNFLQVYLDGIKHLAFLFEFSPFPKSFSVDSTIKNGVETTSQWLNHVEESRIDRDSMSSKESAPGQQAVFLEWNT